MKRAGTVREGRRLDGRKGTILRVQRFCVTILSVSLFLRREQLAVLTLFSW
jgi:hypothetical protein